METQPAFPPETLTSYYYKVAGIFSIKFADYDEDDPDDIDSDPVLFDDTWLCRFHNLLLCWCCERKIIDEDIEDLLGLCDDCIEQLQNDHFVPRLKLERFDWIAQGQLRGLHL